MTSMGRSISLVLAALIAAFALACGSGASSQPAVQADSATATTPTPAVRSAYPLTITGSDGRSITFTEAPKRIVSLSPGATEILFAIGAGGRLAGTDRFSDFPEAAKALPKIDYSNPNLEALVGLRPDLVIAAGRQRNAIPAFEQAGLRVLVAEEPGSVAGVIDRVRLLGRVTDHPTDAGDLAANLQARVGAVKEAINAVTAGPRIYHELDPKLFSVTPNSFIGDVYTILKAQNIVPVGSNPYPQITAESIIRADPQVILLGDSIFPGGSPDEVKRRPGWNVIDAVRGDRVYGLDPDTISRPGPRVVDALEEVARLLYPDRFR
jgi:iron complex transport system substrate-binding protein